MRRLAWFLKVSFEPRDIWIGLYWKKYPMIVGTKPDTWDIYICIIPMLPIRIYQCVKFSF